MHSLEIHTQVPACSYKYVTTHVCTRRKSRGRRPGHGTVERPRWLWTAWSLSGAVPGRWSNFEKPTTPKCFVNIFNNYKFKV